MEENLKVTCLHDSHVALGAKMSPFAGFDMPIQYTNIVDEHNAVRHNVGMFDVSHMGEIFVSGPDAETFVNFIFTNEIRGFEPGKVLYGMMCHPDGGVVDDLLVYREFEPEHFLLVVNAANIDKDFAWIEEQARKFDVKVVNESDSWGQIAVQGPDAEKTVLDVLGLTPAADLTFYTYYEAEWNGKRMVVSRTGYTGEDGFELYTTHENIVEIWNKLIEAGVKPCGLGCRDTLRFSPCRKKKELRRNSSVSKSKTRLFHVLLILLNLRMVHRSVSLLLDIIPSLSTRVSASLWYRLLFPNSEHRFTCASARKYSLES